MPKYFPESSPQQSRLLNRALDKMGVTRQEYRGMTPEMRIVIRDVGLQELKDERSEDTMPYLPDPRKKDRQVPADTVHEYELDGKIYVTDRPLSVDIMEGLGNDFFIDGDVAQALYWHQKAAEAGSVYSQKELGFYYDYDFESGVARDLSEAAKWFEMAAHHGDCSSQYHLGMILIEEGALQDFVKAAFWFEQAIKNIQSFIVDGIEVEHAKIDRYNSSYELANLYLYGRGVAQDLDRCVQLLQDAARLGSNLAASDLGLMHYDGTLGNPDFATAVYWFKMGAEGESWVAQTNLSLCYWNGEGVEQNYSLAFEWMTRAAEHWADLSAAQFFLGLFYENEIGTKKDMAEAVKWYYKAANHGHREAIQKLHDLIGAIPSS